MEDSDSKISPPSREDVQTLEELCLPEGRANPPEEYHQCQRVVQQSYLIRE